MFNETIFLDKIINYLDNQFFNCTSNIKENIFEIESILYFKEKYAVSTGLDKENYKSIYYFIFEEYIDKLLLPLNNKIKNSMKEKRFKVSEFNNLISLEELELALNQQVNIKKDLKILASTILNTEINDLYLEKWKFIQKISKKIFGLSYLEIYKEYYGDIIENIYQQKKEVLELIKRKISTQPKVIIQADLKIESIIERIEDETKKLGLVCNFRDITQKLEKDKFTMYYSYKKDQAC
ncbi:hypothetical protein [Rummeliibacillus suwonensis]|uniref:hypothetical protein n=1 Tax=Rummeliibacillus suwonensis TaxID=1306154 RepID=UPI00289E211E|nr:hypothetical protein [Rummeliibacillus suwonensis]